MLERSVVRAPNFEILAQGSILRNGDGDSVTQNLNNGILAMQLITNIMKNGKSSR